MCAGSSGDSAVMGCCHCGRGDGCWLFCSPAPTAPQALGPPGFRCPVGRDCHPGAPTPSSASLGSCLFVDLFLSQFRSISYMVWKLSDPKSKKLGRSGCPCPQPAVAWGTVICIPCPSTLGPGPPHLPLAWGPGGGPRNAARVCDKVEATWASGGRAAWWRVGGRLGLGQGFPSCALSSGAHASEAVGGWVVGTRLTRDSWQGQQVQKLWNVWGAVRKGPLNLLVCLRLESSL